MSAATFAASAALAPASTSAASSLNRISVPRAPLSARFLRPSLSRVSPSRRRSAAATTCSKRSRRAARGIVVSPDGAGALASSLLGLVLGSLLCLSLCPACWRSRAFGRTEVRRAASRGQLRGRAGLRFGRQPGSACFACSLGPSLCTAGGCFRSLPLLFTGTGGSSEGEHSTPVAAPTPKCQLPDACPALGTAPHVWGKPLRACRIKPIEKNSVPQKTRAAPFLARFEGVVSGHARVRSHYDAPACAARNAASRASASARSRRSSVTAAAAFAASSSARAARRA